MAIKNITSSLHRLIVLLLMFSISIYVSSAPQLPESELSWKNVTVGGVKTAVFSLFKDSRGLMWIGTNSGLYFYDGVTTHPIGEDKLFDTHIYSIVEKDNKLFLGSNNGLLTYDYMSGAVSPYPSATPKEIRALLLVDNNLWIGSLNGIFRLNLSKQEMVNLSKGLPHKSVYSLLRDSRGILYAGTYNGLARWNANSKSFHSVRVKMNNSIQNSLFVNCLLESENGESIYMGGEGFLYKYTPVHETWENIIGLESDNVKSLSKGSDGHILIGTDNGVFDMFNGAMKHYRHDSRQELSLADNEIWCIYADSHSNVWTGHERGFSIASNSGSIRTIKLSTLTHSGEGNEIHVIRRDSKNNLWLAGTNGVIKLSDNSAPAWYRHSDNLHSLSHNRVRDIQEDSEHRLWLATDAGINRFNPELNNFEVFHIVDEKGEHNSNWVYALVDDGDYFWTGSFLNGLHCINKSKLKGKGGTIVADFSLNAETEIAGGKALSNNFVNNILKDRKGNLWILLFRSNILTKYNLVTKSLHRFDIAEMTGGCPAKIIVDKSGRIWCAYKGGAIVFNEDGSHNVVKFPHTNSDETVLALGKVGDGIWVSTQNNVWNIDGHSLKAILLPIPQKSYTAIYEDMASGKVYLGGTDEIIEVDNPIVGNGSDLKTIKMVLNDRGTGRLNLSDIEGGTKGMKIPYGGGVTLVVSTLNYSPESVQRYMYKLASSPLDTIGGWMVMPEGTNTISFSDLKMGDYTLLVKTVGSPIKPVTVPMKVAPPLMMSWWAICLYIIGVLIIIFWIIWYIRKRNLRAFQEQERQKALENVEKKLSFLSTISHDLKTPLSMIMGPVSLMKEKAKDPESKKTLETIYDNAVRLNNMIHRTLELQHLEDTDENLLIISTFDVVDFCKGVFEVFQENNPQKKFVFHSSCVQLLIEADAVKFESVITNLLSNACKYSDDGATISLGISHQNNEVEIVVSDDGVGIADIDQSLVFQRMFRAPATSKLHEGTGLGLYLIKKYLELMNGNINLYSKEGQGTSFVVTLPISEKAVPISSENNLTEQNSNRAKILIVEDNIQISSFIKDVLDKDYTCLVAENGRAGLAIAASFIPDLIIVDEMMPIMNGLEMVRRIKQHPRLAATPIIMLTALGDNKTESESIKLGIDIFMTKPFEPVVLQGRIKQLLKSRTEIKEKVRIEAITEAEAKPIEAESMNEKSLAKIAKIIEENISDPDLNVNLLCEKSGIPNKQLYRLIKKYIGVPPLDYIRNVRLQKAAVLLCQHRFTVAEISYMVGFKTPSYFAKCFQSQFGVKPSQYQSDDETKGNKPDK